MKKFEVFTAEDFACECTPEFSCNGRACYVGRSNIALQANRILNERGKRVTGCPNTDNWERDAEGSPYPQTHEALLIGERPIMPGKERLTTAVGLLPKSIGLFTQD